SALDEAARPGDSAVFISLEQAGYYASLARRPMPWVVVPVGPRYLEGDLAAEAERKTAAPLATGARLHLVLYQGGIAPQHRVVRDLLAARAFPAGERELADSRLLTYLVVRDPPREALPAPV